jgi:hypothetical protein
MEFRNAVDAVCRLEVLKRDRYGGEFRVGEATGFFCEGQGRLYLVTNKHVVSGLEGYADILRIHPTTKGRRLTLNLRREDGKPLWLEHSSKKVDLVALEIPKEKIWSHGESFFWIRDDSGKDFRLFTFTEKDLVPESYPGVKVPLGSFALVLGYPLGFYDKIHPNPIVRLATVSTIPWQDFGGEPCFLIDAVLHPGMSGSPVVSHPESPSFPRKGSECVIDLDKLGRDEEEKEKLRSFLSAQLPELRRQGYLLLPSVDWVGEAKVAVYSGGEIEVYSPSLWPSLRILPAENKVLWREDRSGHRETIYAFEIEKFENRLRIRKSGYGDVYLLGIYSSQWVVGGESLGLHNVWRAKLIWEIIRKEGTVTKPL